jgi:gluconate kinase
VFVHLNGHSELIAERMANREGHFMKQQMLLSQVAPLLQQRPRSRASILLTVDGGGDDDDGVL